MPLGSMMCDEGGCYDSGPDPVSVSVYGPGAGQEVASDTKYDIWTEQGVNNSSIWNSINTAIKSASGILGTRYAVPQLNPGQLIQTGPNGQSLMYQGTAGNMSIPSLSSFGSSLGGGSMLPLLLIGGVVLFIASKGK